MATRITSSFKMISDDHIHGIGKSFRVGLDNAKLAPLGPGFGIELDLPAFAGKPLKPWRRQLVIESDGNIGYQ